MTAALFGAGYLVFVVGLGLLVGAFIRAGDVHRD